MLLTLPGGEKVMVVQTKSKDGCHDVYSQFGRGSVQVDSGSIGVMRLSDYEKIGLQTHPHNNADVVLNNFLGTITIKDNTIFENGQKMFDAVCGKD